MKENKLITLDKAGYSPYEVTELGGFIHDVLWSEGLRDFNTLLSAILISRFATTQECWDDGRSDLKELAKFIALAFLHEYVDVRKGILEERTSVKHK